MNKQSKKTWVWVPVILAALLGIVLLTYYIVFYSNLGRFLLGPKVDTWKQPALIQTLFGSKSACAAQPNQTILFIGIDYRGGDYLYGLADVIRLARVDFSQQTINMVALPRDLLVQIPPGRFKVPGPYKINQAYFFGTPGMLNYAGEGEGPAALNEVIDYNFGVSADHYVVFNFNAFTGFVDAIGGVDVNLPEEVYGGSQGDFPAGEQTLSGERALALARIRENYSDAFRVHNQSLIIKAIFAKLLQPATLVKLPVLVAQFKDAILTDIPLDQLSTQAFCYRDFPSENLITHEVPPEFLTLTNIYLDSLHEYTYGYAWDERLGGWVIEKLMADG